MDSRDTGKPSDHAVLFRRKFYRGRRLPLSANGAHAAGFNKDGAGGVCSVRSLGLDHFFSLAADFGNHRFGYVVTPNVGQLVRYHQDAMLRAAYQKATFAVVNGRLCALIVYLLTGFRLPICASSDLVDGVLSRIDSPTSRVVIAGDLTDRIETLVAQHRLRNVRHKSVTLRDSMALDQYLSFIERESPFRLCFLAIGSPQQEMLAERLRARGVARGLAICM